MSLKDGFVLGYIFEVGTMCKECVREMPGGGSGIRKKSGKGEKGEKEYDLYVSQAIGEEQESYQNMQSSSEKVPSFLVSQENVKCKKKKRK